MRDRAREGGGPRHGSDRVSALSEAFHHIFVAVCTPALQNPHSKLLLLRCIVPNVALLQLILMVLPQHMEARAAAALMVKKVTFTHVSKSVATLSGKAQFRAFSQKMQIAKFSSCPGV